MSPHQPHAPQKHRCWASLFNTRAVAYRLRAGTHHRDTPMASIALASAGGNVGGWP
jgi:phosphoenolpyruvate synthase/pyruvate phosphate dikinase